MLWITNLASGSFLVLSTHILHFHKKTLQYSTFLGSPFAKYVRVRIIMNRWLFHIFGIHSFYATATLFSIWICMQWADAADGGCGGRIRLYTHACSSAVSRVSRTLHLVHIKNAWYTSRPLYRGKVIHPCTSIRLLGDNAPIVFRVRAVPIHPLP